MIEFILKILITFFSVVLFGGIGGFCLLLPIWFGRSTKKKESEIKIKSGIGIRYVIPQRVNQSGVVQFTLRVLKPDLSVYLKIKNNGKEIYKKKQRWVNPANMIEVDFKITDDLLKTGKSLEVFLDE